MRPFAYFEPQTLEETVALLVQHNGRARLLAGGTDLLVEIKEHLRAPDYVINIKKIPGLDELNYDEYGGLRIGATTTVREVELSPVVRTHYTGLGEAARQLGSIQVRNRATVAGNICRASPSADTLPPLIADAAQVALFGSGGERTMPLEKFFTGPGQTLCQSDEILVAIIVPSPAPGAGKAYIKHGRRNAMELATVGVAVSLIVSAEVCTQARIVLGAVAPTPIRAQRAEAVLQGQVIDEAVIGAAAQAARDAARPIDDVRSSAAYRREMVFVLTQRAIRLAGTRAGAQVAQAERIS